LLKISVFEQRRKRNHGIRIEEVEEATLGGTEIQKYLIPSIELSLLINVIKWLILPFLLFLLKFYFIAMRMIT
jgi:hypothetical protein